MYLFLLILSGDIGHHTLISEEDLEACYAYFSKDLSNPVVLQEKVFFDLVLYLARPRRENLQKLCTYSFEVAEESCRKVCLQESG